MRRSTKPCARTATGVKSGHRRSAITARPNAPRSSRVSDIAAFFEAVQSGHPSKVEALLDANASLAKARNEKGQSAVLVAVYTGRKEIRDLMLARGIALELDEAAATGQLARVKQLVDKDPALANNFSHDGFQVFALAGHFGHGGLAGYCLARGAVVTVGATSE